MNSGIVDAVEEAGFDTVDDLLNSINRPKCPNKDVLDDALYLVGMFAEGSEGKEVAEKLHKALIELYETM